jgi:hypothetical protein
MVNISLEWEVWKDVVWYEWLYMVSNMGRVYSLLSNKIKKVSVGKFWYGHLALNNNRVRKEYLIHRLVAIAFLENKENKPQVNHINGMKSDNRVENLEWVTQSENQIHALDAWLKKRKKTFQYDMEWNLLNTFKSLAEAGKFLNKTSTNIWKCCNWWRKQAHWYIWRYSPIWDASL